MCGRYTLTVNNRPDLLGLGLQKTDRYNIAPQSQVLVIDETSTYTLMPWDYSPHWAKTPMHLINARSETLREKPSFRGARRCVFIADGWYEWHRDKGVKTPWFHHMDGDILYFAGIYNKSSGCAIVTRQAHDNIVSVHHRQPVLLEERAVEHWLEGHDLFASAISHGVKLHPVSSRVNKPANDDANLIEAIALSDRDPDPDPDPESAPAPTQDSGPTGESGDLFD